MKKSTYLVGFLIPFLISGCAYWSAGTTPQFGKKEGGALAPHQNGWWQVSFQMEWPENEDPRWHTDMILAHKVLAPVIAQYKERIELWRFHRRAMRDKAGHQFRFLFYSSPQVAAQIFDQVKSDSFLKEMIVNGVLIQSHCDDTASITRPHPEDTSDRRWSPPVQRSWPYYIMGVSEMWLHMISEIVAQHPSDARPDSLPDCLVFYQKVEESITEAWRKEGRHAYLHHLNAIFGYESLQGSDGSPMRF